MNFQKRYTIILAVLVISAALFWFYPIQRGLDLRGGAVLTYRIDTKKKDGKERSADERSKLITDTVSTFRKRIDTFGLKEVGIEKAGLSSVKVEIPGRESAEVERIVKLLSQTGTLEFRILARDSDPVEGGGTFNAESENAKRLAALESGETYVAPKGETDSRYHGFRWYPNKPRVVNGEVVNQGAGQWVRLDTWDFQGEDLADTRVVRDTRGPGYVVGFDIVITRGNAFGDFTGPNSAKQGNERQMAIILDGQIETAPSLQSRLQGGGQISGGGGGGFSKAEADDLANVLKSGALKVKPILESQYSVGPSLGEDAIRKGFTAIVIGFCCVLVLMIAYYLLQGLIANFALLFNLLILLAALAFLGSSLSLPGIAGIVLTVGMAVDANILIFERIREEQAKGKTLGQAVKNGYDRAFVAIIDSNLTTVLTAIVLYLAGSGPIKGFAITLILGILASMFTALFVTRTIVVSLVEKGIMKKIRFSPLMGGTPKLDYMRVRPLMIGISFVVVVAGLFYFEERGPDKYDIDFTGGSEVRIELRDKMSIDDVRARVLDIDAEASVVTVKSSRTSQDDLNLDRESSAFRITAPNPDATSDDGSAEERVKNKFEDDVTKAFRNDLLPIGVSSRKVGDVDGDLRERFLGGWRFELNFDEPIDEAAMKAIASQSGFPKASHIQKLPSWSGSAEGATSQSWAIFAKLPNPTGSPDFNVRYHDALTTASKAAELTLTEPIPSTTYIGSIEAKTIRTSAFIAVLFSLIVQILYIAFRFRGFSFGFAAVAALIHDVSITLGIVALVDALGIVDAKLNLPIIAAFLTLIGYSMNDTIVVFDRIRENSKRWKDSFTNLINLSINQNLSRTIRTSVTTFVVLLVIFIVNYRAGSVLEGFSFVMLVGVVVGTYSSIFVASPMLMFLPWFWRKFSDMVLVPLWYKADNARLVTWLPVGILLLLTPIFALIGTFAWIFVTDPDRAMNLARRRKDVA